MDGEGRVASAARPSRVAPAMVAGAPWLFVVLWSTGFVVAHYGTQDAGPLTFLAIRLTLAAVVLGVIASASGAPRPTRPQVLWACAVGVAMHAVYLGGVFLAISWGMPSGIGALIAGLHPVLTAIAGRAVLGDRLRRLQWFGVALGFAGVIVVVVDRLLARSVVRSIEGAILFDEQLGPLALVGLAVALAGVALTLRQAR